MGAFGKFLPLVLPIILGLIDQFAGSLTAWVAAHPGAAVYISLAATIVAALTKSILPALPPKE